VTVTTKVLRAALRASDTYQPGSAQAVLGPPAGFTLRTYSQDERRERIQAQAYRPITHKGCGFIVLWWTARKPPEWPRQCFLHERNACNLDGSPFNPTPPLSLRCQCGAAIGHTGQLLLPGTD